MTSRQRGVEVAKFMFIYKGEATDLADMSQEQAAEVMAKWAAWMQRVGSSLADLGTPFGPGTSVVDDGSARSAAPLTGFSIVEADDMAGARALADGHPYLSDSTGDFAIDIYEMMPVPEM